MLSFTFCHIYFVKTTSVCARNQCEPQLRIHTDSDSLFFLVLALQGVSQIEASPQYVRFSRAAPTTRF